MTAPNFVPVDPVHNKPPRWIHAYAWGTIGLLVLLLGVTAECYRGQNIWRTWIASHELRSSNYAETIHADDLFRTRANTWSNLAYVLVGLYAICFGCYDRMNPRSAHRNYLTKTPAMSLLFGAACCYLGFGSGLFHASLTRWGQQLDVGSMYAPLLACIAINLGRYVPQFPSLRSETLSNDSEPNLNDRVPTWPLLAIGVIVISYLLYHYKWSMSSGQILPLHIAIVAGFAIADFVPSSTLFSFRRLHAYSRERRWLAVSLLALILAVVCRQLDVAGKFSTPESWFQGHAVWHLLTAASLASMYLYYRSESRDLQSANSSNAS